MVKELCVLGENGGAKRNVYMGLIWVYVEGLLRLVLLADQFISTYIRFTLGKGRVEYGSGGCSCRFFCALFLKNKFQIYSIY